MADASAMAAMAACFMGGGRPSAPPPHTQPTSETPRTIPTPSFANTSRENSQSQAARPTPTPEVVVTSPPSIVASPLTFSPSTAASPTITERDMNTNTGPSLRGDPAQLKAAREFMNQLSGGKKASHGRPQPTRHDSMSSTTSSARSSRARDVPSPNPGFNYLVGRNPPPSGRSDNTLSGWQGFSSGPNNKSQPPPTSVTQHEAPFAPPSTPAGLGNFSTQTAPSTSAKVTETPTQQPIRVATPATPVKQDSGAGLLNRQMATVTNTLNSNVNNSVAPHLRKKADANVPKAAAESKDSTAESVVSPVTQSAVAKEVKKENIAPAPAAAGSTSTANKVELNKEIKFEPTASQDAPTKPFTFGIPPTSTGTAVPATNGAPTSGSKAHPITLDASSSPPPSATATFATGQGDVKKMAWIVSELKELKAQVKELESENLELNQKAERLQESEERRKFLGTDDARAPFTISITNPHGQSHTFQASKDKKVKQLILDARFKFKLDMDSCKGPTLSYQGKQVGHAMMMGELGVVQGSTLAFSYEGADEEEL